MPSNERIRGSIVEMSDRLGDLGYGTKQLVGPIAGDGEEIRPEDIDENTAKPISYYLVAESGEQEFYIEFSTEREFSTIVFPLSVEKRLANRLSDEELRGLLDEEIDIEDFNSEEREVLLKRGARNIIRNTPAEHYLKAQFVIGSQASTSLVDYVQTTVEGFPVEFRCRRAIFPYTENLTLEYVDDRVHPVIIAGNRGRRYVDSSVAILNSVDGESLDPNEYEVRLRF